MKQPGAHLCPKPSSRKQVFTLFSVLIGANIAVWVLALSVFHGNPVLLGTAFLAYSLGLRHAFDADHIAAIDNVTRKLAHEGQRSMGAGLYFSLGHSSVVVALSLAIVVTTGFLADRLDGLSSIGGLIGTIVSSAFLLVIGAANLVVLVEIAKAFRKVSQGEAVAEAEVDAILSRRGLLGRIFQRLFGLVRKGWHMYPLGVLFGLGFDTATEIGLLGISAAQAAHGVAPWQIMILPALFTAGMSLLDTTDSAFMTGAYKMAFGGSVRKLYYNMTITFVSVIVAFVIGGIEALGLLVDRMALKGPIWNFIGGLGDHFGLLGYAIVAFFALSWLVSWAIYRLKGYDRFDAAMS